MAAGGCCSLRLQRLTLCRVASSSSRKGAASSLAAKRSLRNRLVRRAGRNLATLGPMMSGAVAGSVVNHRETRRLGEQVRDDLRRLTRR